MLHLATDQATRSGAQRGVDSTLPLCLVFDDRLAAILLLPVENQVI